MTIRGCCESCGKVYRIPTAERDYTCKACGGTVHPAEESVPDSVPEENGAQEQPVPPKVDARHAHGRHGSILEHREALDASRRKGARVRQLVWGLLLCVFLAGYVAYQMSRPKPALASEGVAGDLQAGTDELVQAWNAGDIEALVKAFHPDARSSTRDHLQRVAQNRGWTVGFPAARGAGSNLSAGTADQPQKAVVLLAFGEEDLRAKFSLQYEPLYERWFGYHVDIPPPPLAPTLARFRAAWAQSSPEALVPLFPPDDAKKLTELVARKAREFGWSPSFPELGEATTTGELELRRATERVPGLKVETVVPVAEHQLTLRWHYRSEPDAWFLANLIFPKKQ